MFCVAVGVFNFAFWIVWRGEGGRACVLLSTDKSLGKLSYSYRPSKSLQECSMFLRNVSKCLTDYTVSQPRRPRPEILSHVAAPLGPVVNEYTHFTLCSFNVSVSTKFQLG